MSVTDDIITKSATVIDDDFIPIRDKDGKLLMRYNSRTAQVEIQRRRVKTVVDLNQYKRSAMSDNVNDLKARISQLEYEIDSIKHIVWAYMLNDEGKQRIRSTSLKVSDCVDLIRDVGEDYIRLKYLSAKSAAQQGGTHGDPR